MTRSHVAPMAVLLAAAASVHAQPVTINVDQTQSSINVGLSIPGASDNDTAPIAGTLDFDLDLDGGMVTLTDFDLTLTENINLLLEPFGSSLSVTGTGVSVEYQPGAPASGPVPLGAGGAFTFMDVPSLPSGNLAYTGSGLICILLIPCSESLDLELDIGTNLADTVSGTLTVVGDTVTLNGSISLTLPVPADGSLGTSTINATIVGTGTLPMDVMGACELCVPGQAPDCTIQSEEDCTNAGGTFLGDGVVCPTVDACPCNFNCDDFLNDQDFFDFVNAFFGAGADYNDDGFANDQDFFDFVNCFFTPPPGC